jgi:hypothetical protein
LQTWIKMGGGQTKTLTHFAEIRKQLNRSMMVHIIDLNVKIMHC